MKYLCLIYENEREWENKSPADGEAIMNEYFTFTEDIQKRGLMKSGAPLQTTDTATTVRVNGSGEAVLSDGPFAETKEWLAGYYLLDCPDLDTATAQAARIPAARHGAIEVRPVMEIPGM